MQMETAPLNPAERLYLGSRIPLLTVLFIFGVMGVMACLVFMNWQWASKPYGFAALLILNIAASNLLWRALRKQWRDAHAGKKWVLNTILGDKYIREKRTMQYFLKVDGKEYRVAPKAYEMYEIGQPITVFLAYHSKSWMGFTRTGSPA